ncbi:hypothetical protein NM688_g4422 [Phlebia brevispora]|uniref:Uncharacterized protein n=1 Tax=Phlebia brevispora TaxID=194682 RepID=A0ACC1T3C4_9APHY|nr:hypothetical protein NM688_g4422 [Phlebia brevispora]
MGVLQLPGLVHMIFALLSDLRFSSWHALYAHVVRLLEAWIVCQCMSGTGVSLEGHHFHVAEMTKRCVGKQGPKRSTGKSEKTRGINVLRQDGLQKMSCAPEVNSCGIFGVPMPWVSERTAGDGDSRAEVDAAGHGPGGEMVRKRMARLDRARKRAVGKASPTKTARQVAATGASRGQTGIVRILVEISKEAACTADNAQIWQDLGRNSERDCHIRAGFVLPGRAAGPRNDLKLIVSVRPGQINCDHFPLLPSLAPLHRSRLSSPSHLPPKPPPSAVMSISIDDLVASLSSNHIGQEATDLAALQAQLQTMFYANMPPTRRSAHANTPTSRTPTTTSFCWDRPDLDRRRSNSVASMSSRKDGDDRDCEQHLDVMDEDERMVEDMLFPATTVTPNANATSIPLSATRVP